MKKILMISLSLSILLLPSCRTQAGAEAGAEVIAEADIPIEFGDLRLLLCPEPELHGDINMEFRFQ